LLAALAWQVFRYLRKSVYNISDREFFQSVGNQVRARQPSHICVRTKPAVYVYGALDTYVCVYV
jgi:hypothetical protein